MWKMTFRFMVSLIISLIIASLWEKIPWIASLGAVSAGIVSSVFIDLFFLKDGIPRVSVKEFGIKGILLNIGIMLLTIMVITITCFVIQWVGDLIQSQRPGKVLAANIFQNPLQASKQQKRHPDQSEAASENEMPEREEASDSEGEEFPEKFEPAQKTPGQDLQEETADIKEIARTDKDDNPPGIDHNDIGFWDNIKVIVSEAVSEKIEDFVPPLLADRGEHTEKSGVSKDHIADDKPEDHGGAANPVPDDSNSKTDIAPEQSDTVTTPAPESPGLMEEEKPSAVTTPAPESPEPVEEKKPSAVIIPIPEGPGPILDMKPEQSGSAAAPYPEGPGPILDIEPEGPGSAAASPPSPEEPGIIPEIPPFDIDTEGTGDKEPDDEIKEPDNDIKEPDDEIKEPDDEIKEPNDGIKEPNDEIKEPDDGIKEPNDEIKEPEKRNDCQVPPIIKKEGEAASRVEKERIVPAELADQIVVISGETRIWDEIYYAGQKRWYEIHTTVSGLHFFEIISEKDCSEYSIVFCKVNVQGECMDHMVFPDVISEDILSFPMNSDETYRICIEQPWGFGGYELRIGYPQEVQDISDYQVFQNQLHYPEEKQEYLLSPECTDTLRIDITGLAENEDVRILVYGEDESQEEYEGNKSGLTIRDVQEGQTYRILVCQDQGFCTYQLRIGSQKETVDLTGYTGAEDSIEFQDQINRYEVMLETSGSWQIQLLNIQGEEFEIEMQVYDSDGNPIDRCDCTGEESMKLSGKGAEGESITILIHGKSGTGTYLLDYRFCPSDI